MKRLTPIAMVAVISLQAFALSTAVQAQQNITFDADKEFLVHKSPTCGCCTGWVDHMTSHGAHTKVQHSDNLADLKADLGIPANARSCHTAITESGYVFEGHIPAKFIQQFLSNPIPDTKGLVVPGMPVGSPGMEYNDQFMPYAVYLLKSDGSLEVFAKVNSLADQT